MRRRREGKQMAKEKSRSQKAEGASLPSAFCLLPFALVPSAYCLVPLPFALDESGFGAL